MRLTIALFVQLSAGARLLRRLGIVLVLLAALACGSSPGRWADVEIATMDSELR